MAKHRRHHRKHGRRTHRRMSLAGVLSPFKGSLNGMDVLVGAGVGILGIGLGNYIVNKIYATDPTKTPELLKQGAPLIGALVAGVGLHFLAPKVMPKLASKTGGWMVGATVAAAPIVVIPMLKKAVKDSPDSVVNKFLPSFSGTLERRSLPMYAGGYGALATRPVYDDRPHLADLAASAMDDSDED